MCVCVCVCVCGFCNAWVFWSYVYLYLLCFCIVSFMYIYSLYAFIKFCKVCILIVRYMFCSVHFVFIVPTGTLWLPCLRFFLAFSSVVRQMPGYNSQIRGTARTLPKLIVLFYLLLAYKCVLTTATGCQPNCS